MDMVTGYLKKYVPSNEELTAYSFYIMQNLHIKPSFTPITKILLCQCLKSSSCISPSVVTLLGYGLSTYTPISSLNHSHLSFPCDFILIYPLHSDLSFLYI